MVVLVMFILTATAQIAGIKVNLPKASSSMALSQPRPRRSPSTMPARSSWTPIPSPCPSWRTGCAPRALNPDFPVIVRGDAAVQYQKVVEVLDLLRRLELAQVGLVTGKPQ